MQRRLFMLQTAATLVMMVKRGWAAQGVAAPDSLDRRLGDRLLALLPRHPSTVVLGQAVIRACSDQRDGNTVLKHLMIKLDLPSCEADWPPCQGLQQRLKAKICQDFKHGHVILVDGWMLADVEARLFSLAALMHDRNAAWHASAQG